jgi:hypothetical protein
MITRLHCLSSILLSTVILASSGGSEWRKPRPTPMAAPTRAKSCQPGLNLEVQVCTRL